MLQHPRIMQGICACFAHEGIYSLAALCLHLVIYLSLQFAYVLGLRMYLMCACETFRLMKLKACTGQSKLTPAPQVRKLFEHTLVQTMCWFQPDPAKSVADAVWAALLTLSNFANPVLFLLTPANPVQYG